MINRVYDWLAAWLGIWPAFFVLWLVPPACWWLLIWWSGYPRAALIALVGLLIVWGLTLMILAVSGASTGAR